MGTSTSNNELAKAAFGVSQRIQCLLVAYEEIRELHELDSLVYHINRLYRIVEACSSGVSEATGVSLPSRP